MGSISSIATPFSSVIGGVADVFSVPQPGAPDYRAAAEQTAAGNLENAQLATQANRPTQVNPFGTSSWEQDDQGNWTQSVSFSPEMQNLYDMSTQAQTNLLQSQMPTYGENRTKVMESMLSRVGTDIAREKENLHSKLLAQGIPVGSDAYNAQMEQLDRKETDARQQAEISASQMAGQEYESALSGRGQRVAEAMAFNPSQPTFSPFYNQQAVPGPDYMGATTAEGNWNLAGWNAQQQMRNNIMQGLFSLGSSAVGAPGGVG